MTSDFNAQARVSVPTSSAFDPSYVVNPGTAADAVVGIFGASGRGSGAVLGDGQYVLTAAHVIFGEPTSSLQIRLDLTSGQQFINVAEVFIHPDYSPDATGFSSANDIAIMRLSSAAPVAGFDIYRGNNEVGSVFTLTGYGVAGTGAAGTVANDPGDGDVKRTGQNRYDAVDGQTVFGLDDFLGDPTPDGSLLFYDFDDGTRQRDAMDVEFGIADTGLGAAEVNSTSGDSGAPTFINGQIAGVVSGGTSSFADIDNQVNASFGEISFDTRISFFQSWIDGIVGTSLTEQSPGQLPDTTGTSAADVINANAQGGTIRAGDGADTVFGNVGGDIIYGNPKDDLLYGGDGLDVLYGGQDSDRLFGGNGNDVLYGNKVGDQIYGNQGNDTLYGGKLNDSMFGGQGDDALYGGQGEDVLTGNGGGDFFVVTAGSGSDTILDYNQAEGDIILGGFFSPFSQAEFTNGGLLLREGDQTLFLVGVTSADAVSLL
ncbi:MAG: trypsin-like serine protease [Pseudomonadota bacterium]